MASGDTKLSICSDAMIMLGASPISSFAEETDASQTADRLYDNIRDTLLQQYEWSWALKKVQLAQLSSTPANEWKYAYALPGDMLGVPRAVFDSSAVGMRPVREWELYGTSVFTNYESVWIDYQYTVPEGLMPSYFVRVLKTALASAFSIPVADSSGKADFFHAMAYGPPGENMRGGLMRVAMNIDGGKPPQAFEDFALIAVRG
ncbi:hypothetical protein UFOVP375_40 [uncultured Caudovirales phage]|jgi:hypothetical protein|uniref:Uncharacterized protein n=1 Tax=uncultured Caudovirales phage TaxID=2100421 RepID=A0A6J7XQH4_9CAUD|nr:hypothetical protein UFOVP375_40 [uncultured Caudovirales phage]